MTGERELPTLRELQQKRKYLLYKYKRKTEIENKKFQKTLNSFMGGHVII